MGHVFTEDALTSQQIYILGFVSREGTTLRTVVGTATALAPPVKNSLESWLPRHWAYTFLDFQPLRVQQAGRAPKYFYLCRAYDVKPYTQTGPRSLTGCFICARWLLAQRLASRPLQ